MENSPPPYRHSDSAPFAYFDFVPGHGVLNGAIQIDLVGCILIPTPDGDVAAVPTGRLRCSPATAAQLRDAPNAALKMFEDLQKGPPLSELNVLTERNENILREHPPKPDEKGSVRMLH